MSGDVSATVGGEGGSIPSRRSPLYFRDPLWMRLKHFICTHNPFYAISAALVFAGLRISFGPNGHSQHAWGVAAGMGGYILLLAVTTLLLVRFVKAWDDIRSLLLLIVLLMVAVSCSVDEILIANYAQGAMWLLSTWGFAVLVSEAVLHGLGIRLPMRFRVPYYALLTLHFVYPLAIVGADFAPRSHALHWMLLGFPIATSIAILMLIPAARAGGALVARNGTPWRWPWFPWPVFVTLGLFAGWRTYSLCIAFDAWPGTANVFGPYFLALPCLAAGAVLLEVGIQARNRLATSLGLLAASAVPLLSILSRHDAAYDHFVNAFTVNLGCTPLFALMCLAASFYAIAAARRVQGAADFLSASLAAFCLVNPGFVHGDAYVYHTALYLMAVAALQMVVAVLKGTSSRALISTAAATASVTLFFHQQPTVVAAAIAQVLIVASALVAAVFDDRLARWLRSRAVVPLVIVNVLWMMGLGPQLLGWPHWAVMLYPVAWIAFAILYGAVTRCRGYFRAAVVIASVWLGVYGTQEYRDLREHVAGLDLLAGGSVFFGMAVLVSLHKGGVAVCAIVRRLLRW